MNKQYKYNCLKDFIGKTLDRINFYALVLDSSSYYFNENIQKYQVIMKLIDASVHPNPMQHCKYGFITTTFFTRNLNWCPRAPRMGTIIRVHRADVRIRSDNPHINCDIGMKGAWAIFDPIELYYPVSHYGRSFTFIDKDKNKIKEIRKFGNLFFGEHNIIKFILPLNSSKLECNMICRVLTNNDHKITVYNGEKFYTFKISQLNRLPINPGTICYIRGLYMHHKKLKFNDYTGIFEIPEWHYSYQRFQRRFESQIRESRELAMKFLEYGIRIESYKYNITNININKDNCSLEYVSLKSLHNPESKIQSGQKFKVKVFIVDIKPSNLNDWHIKLTSKK